jgi:serine/threonine protein kinase
MGDELTERAEARLGQVINGKYRLDHVLGVGGTAVVFAATHRIGHRVALKMLHREYSRRDEIRTRFLREGYVVNRIAHPGVVRVIDDDADADGVAYLVMDLLTGTTVEALLHARGGGDACGPSVELTLGIADATLDVLAAAHAVSIVHRDIKPANLFLTQFADLKVLDFGVARLVDAASITGTGELWGTAAFMPPEQARGERSVDHRSDLWAVGAVLFRCLSGHEVHEAASDPQQLVRAATTPARPLATVAPRVPKAVCDVVDRALAFRPEQRWESAHRMRMALRSAHAYEPLG